MREHNQPPASPGNHLSGEQLVDLLYRESSTLEANHLQECADCRNELEAYRTALGHLSSWDAPARDLAYGTTVWNRISGRIVKPKRALFFPGFTWARLPVLAWGSVAALGVLLLLVPFVRHGGTRPVRRLGSRTQLADTSQQQLLSAAFRDHIERTSELLTEIENSSSPREETAEILDDRQSLNDLVAENRLYRQTAEQQHDFDAAAVLGELETVLLDLQHISPGSAAEQIKEVQQRISETNLGFKLQVVKAAPDFRDKRSGTEL